MICRRCILATRTSTSTILTQRLKHVDPHRHDKGTWILKHVYQPERTPEGQPQRRPDEIEVFQKYELVKCEDYKSAGPLEVILLEDIEGVGLQFDVIGVDRNLARNNLIPLRKAVYASPFDLQYYAKKKEKMMDELLRRVRIPYEHVKLGRTLMKQVIPLLVSMDKPWTIDKNIAFSSLQQAGIVLTDEGIFLPKNAISGPNFELEAMLIRFYIVINRQYIVPMLGRLSHISSDDTKQNLYPDQSQLPSSEQLKKFGLRPEDPVFYRSPEVDANFDVFEFMKDQ